MLSVLASLGLLGAMAALGIALLRRATPFLSPLERFAYGAPIGMVVGTLALVPIGIIEGLRAPGVAAVGIGCATTALWLVRDLLPPSGGLRIAQRESGGADGPVAILRAARRRISLVPTIVIGLFAVRWAFFWRDAVQYRADGLWAGHVNIWGDWTVHLGIVSSFAYGQNFPPTHPRLAGQPFGYHYLSDLTAAAQVALGMDPGYALSLHSFVLCVLVAIAIYAFARRMTRDSRAATVALVLFLLGGAFGWLEVAGRMAASGDPIGTLTSKAWDFHVKTDWNMAFVNMFFGFLASQRAFLYGLPIALAVVSTLLIAVRGVSIRRDGARGHGVRLFVIAGVIAGLLPLAHLGTLLALAMVTPILFLLFPSRGWVAFHAAWIAVALPQLLLQLGGGAGALASIRSQLGWVADPDPWPWFWVKNLGGFVILAAAGLAGRRYLAPRPRRFLLAFGSIFIATNVLVFQPWDWDNHKFLVYWFLSICIVSGAVVARTWRRHRSVAVRGLLAGLLVTMTLSGILENVAQALGQSTYRMLDAQQLDLAAQVRARTAPDARFIIGMQSHDSIATLTGRRIFVGYRNWLWAEGADFEGRQEEVRAVYAGAPAARAILVREAIDYVVVGPYEVNELGADMAAWLASRPVIAATADWAVFDVRGLRAEP